MKKYVRQIFWIVSIGMFLQSCGMPSVPSNGDGNPGTQAPVEIVMTPTEAPQELLVPSSGTEAIGSGSDNEESASASQKTVPNGDDYQKNRFERPFTANDMAYLPDVDIKAFSLSKDKIFYYTQIVLTDVSPQTKTVSGYYGIEMDLNMDGRSDILVITKAPLSSDWSRSGVAVFYDSNGDVGGMHPTHVDDVYTGNGLDSLVYDSGEGLEVDLAWARAITGTNKAIVEIAFKTTLIESYTTFLWGVMASSSPIDPSKFYYSDSIAESVAGSPVKGSQYYPLKELAGFDNTCRIPAGFEATGNEPLGCLVKGPEKEPEFQPPVPPPGGKSGGKG